MIIDVHSHLGDILYLNGEQLIHKRGVQMDTVFDPQGISEKSLMRSWGLGKVTYKLLLNSITGHYQRTD